MKRITIYLIIGIIFLSEASAQDQPNFIFILTDDQPYGFMGCVNDTIARTPNLDKLVKEGVLFTNAHITSAICTPSRTSILLSQYERKHSVNFNSGTSISDEAWKESYPVVMKKAGYYTGWIGKNHAPVGKGGYESGVMEKSFDYWYGGHKHLTFYPKQRHEIFEGAKSDTQAEIIQEGVDDFLDPNERKLNGAIRFLNQRPKDQPFLLSVNFNLPHGAGTGSMQLRPTDDDLYKTAFRDLEMPLPKEYLAKKDIENPKLPKHVLKVENRQKGYDYVDKPETLTERLTRMYQAMSGIDRLVGKLRKRLKELGEDKNTVIIFTSDHGLFLGQYGLGGKALCYEITTHVPLIVYDPRAPKKARKRKTDALVQTIDIAPTMLHMAGIKEPESYQGKNISNLILGTDGTEVRNFLFTENLWATSFGNPRCESVQNKKWKYIRYYKNNSVSPERKVSIGKRLGLKELDVKYGVTDAEMITYQLNKDAFLEGEEPVYEELYNLENDPLESTNLISEKKYQHTLEQMRKAWEVAIREARGEGFPKVYRYTAESKREFKKD